MINVHSCEGTYCIDNFNNDNYLVSKEYVEKWKEGKNFQKAFTIDPYYYRLILGTSLSDILSDKTYILDNSYIYGGLGNDTLLGHGNQDILIGGPGNDILNGGSGDDRYLYWKGHGLDSIEDASGKDTLELHGLDVNDLVSITDEPYEIQIEINFELAITISKYRSKNSEFKIKNNSTGEIIKYDSETNEWDTIKIGRIACPTNVEIYDEQGNLVYVMIDGIENYEANDYGYFSVIEENGEFVKYYEMADNLTFKIVANDNGKMNVEFATDINDDIYFKEEIVINKDDQFISSVDGKSLVRLVNGIEEEIIPLELYDLEESKKQDINGGEINKIEGKDVTDGKILDQGITESSNKAMTSSKFKINNIQIKNILNDVLRNSTKFKELNKKEKCIIDGKYWYDNKCNDSEKVDETESEKDNTKLIDKDDSRLLINLTYILISISGAILLVIIFRKKKNEK